MPKKLSAPEIRRQTVTYFREIAEVFHAVQELARQCILTYITTAEMWSGPIDPLFPLLLAEMLETHDLHTPLF